MTKNSYSEQPTSLNRYQRWVITCLVIGICLPLLDATIIGVAIPSLTVSLSTSVAQLQWVSTLYTLSATVTVTICAWATRRVGAKNLWLTGLAVFTLGSLFCGFASHIDFLLASRVIQGIGAGILMPVMQTVLVNAVGKQNLKGAMATIAVPTVIAPIAGPIVAGYLLHIGDWRLIFFINVPIGIVAIALSAVYITKNDKSESIRFDLMGFLLLTPSLLFMIYSLSLLTKANTMSTLHWLIMAGILLASLIFILLFVRHTRNKTSDALIQLAPFKIRSFTASIWLLLLSSISFYGGLFALPIMFIHGFQQSELLASIWIGAHGVGALLSRSYLKSLSGRFGVSNTALIGTIMAIFGTVPLFLHNIPSHPEIIIVTMLLRGAGIGLLTLLAMSHAYHELPATQIPDASVITRIGTLFGASLGTATVAVLYSIAPSREDFSLILLGLLFITFCCTIPALKLRR
ncbi:DHA2 family efflux MFS transporter permease subunit [Photorhabdus noenieputensis]|uniref:DHA2 family efflux MFS transporter permease subunit n=1 Tax=Photorhabdus noenieputensis TaxID=1208607 RepID=UPI001BD6825B|nr:DHA2 family efflux MFS transporter permease subunit [Photorhabdus noenieputensis]MBS9438276.1 DHA2 family efflux MFS transporter permease subunit [Photorhabdus noenieputensis]MCK3669864.1 DHA2 family efflux MFS transporter permease subunit [Photorhabdus noenieputensis]